LSTIGLEEMLLDVLGVPVARTSEAAATLHLKVPNASNKLKALWSEGYILRLEQSAESGGVEYEYLRIV
jgi:predicted transcriptional regulator